ncbi:TAXI family TRAP transporter solute-binding subunit [Pseudoduganella sp. OTU4001]|uniref:TAXI family TRAP transporter solute-binding subunit n=1 Tax=Pseudoduganella sp. OTU4001 TaxID=3043854 RepID=UPI00313C9912
MKLTKFTQLSLRDLIVSVAPTVIVVAAACALAYWIIDPTPPRVVKLSTGQENSAYENIGKRYAQAMSKHGIKVTLQPSQGSQENLQRLNRGDTDIAFVQSGSTNEADAERRGLVSLGSLFTEPLWLFMREKKAVTSLTKLKGLKINLGPEGSGAPRLFRQVLQVNGVMPGDFTASGLENTPATVELLEGRIDALVFAAAPDDPLIQMLLMTPGIKLFDFTQAEAYTRRLPFLTHVTLPRGIVDLGRDLPARDYQLIAPTATLVAREDLHPALVDLFVQAASNIHSGAGWFQQQGQFPSPRYTEIPVAHEAAKFYKDGPPFLQRYMSFWLANLFDRLWVVLLAVGALVLPLSRVVPPLYVWRIRSRVYRWYGQLRSVEQGVDEGKPREELLRRLDQIEERVNRLSVPLSFADEFYGLRNHIEFVRQRLRTNT